MVRFGKKLANNRVTHWESEYVDYARLKALVRPRLSAPTLEAGADAFERAVLGEIRKVEAFYIAKVGEFARQLELFAAHRRAHARTLRAAVRPSNRHGNANEMAVANAMSVNGERARDADDERDVLILRTAEADGSGEGEAGQSPSQSDESDELRAAARSVARMSSSAIAALLDTDDAAASGSGSESDSGVPMALGSATHLPTVHADDAPSARAVRQLRGAPHVQRTKAKRRHAWVELAREIYLLRNFTKLNYTAVVKICKKYNKVTGAALDARKLLGPFAFVEADELERIRDTVHRRFAAEFCNGDLHLASQLLLEKQGVDVDWNQFRKGMWAGACIVFGVWLMWDVVVDEALHHNDQGATLWQRPLFRVFRGIGCCLLLQWAWGVLKYVWQRNRVNFIYLLDFNPRTLSGADVTFYNASKHTAVFFVVFMLWYKTARGDFPRWLAEDWYPLIIFVLFVARLAWPPRARWNSLPPVLSTLASPFGQVTFATSCIGDLMTSLVKPFYDLVLGLCIFGSGTFLEDPATQERVCANNSAMLYVVKPIILALPLWLRMHQNLRRYYDTRMRHPYLSNAFKYAFAHSIVLFGAFNPELLQFNKGSEVTSYLFVTVFVISTLYTYSWDIFMDWSLGDIKHGLLRRERMFAWRAAYYVAIVVDFVLRFVWTMTLVPVARVHFQDGATVLDFAESFLGPIEVLRRSMWAAFRVENEHLHSTERFRKKYDFVPLLFETAVGKDAKPEQEAKVSGQRLLIEASAFAGVVIVLAVLAILFRKSMI